MPNSDSSRWWLASEAVLSLAVVALPWALGGAAGWSLWLLLGLANLALVLWMIGASRNHRRLGWHPVLLLPLSVAAVGALQLVPLPGPLLALVSPPMAELREFNLVPLGLDGWRPVSVDVPSTLRALARVLSLGALLFVARELGRVPAVRRRVLQVVALSATSTAVCGFVHLLSGLEAFLGVVHFGGNVPFVTSFGNTNHLAAWLLLGGTVALGLALDTPSRDAAVGWGAAALVCGLAIFLTYSRGGIASFVLTWLVVGGGLLVSRAGSFRLVLPWGLIATTIVGAGLLAFDQLVERADTVSSLEKLSATKIELWPMLAHGVWAFARGGMGLGAFELGFSRFHERDLTVTFTHPETFPLQLVADLGVVGAAAVALIAVWVARSTWRQARGLVLERTVLLALFGLLVHDLFDFALELNAVAPVAAICLGLLTSLEGDARRVPVRGRGPLVALLVGSLGGVLAWQGGPAHLAAEAQLAAAISAREPVASVRALGIQLVDRHPSDWVLYANLANDAATRDDPREALAWVNRVLFLRPADAHAHVSAARALLRLGRTPQALAELKAAWTLGDPSTLALGLSLVSKQGDWSRLLLDLPGHLDRLWDVLARQGRFDEARALIVTALDFPPSDAVREEAALLLVRHDAQRGDPATALAAIDGLPAALRARGEVALARAALLQRLDRGREAVGELERLLAREPQNVTAGLALCDVLSSLHQPAAARAVLERLRPFAGAPALRATLFRREAESWIAEDRLPRALEALQTAARIEPARPDHHYRAAELFEQMGSLSSALDELRRGRLLDTPEGARSREAQLKRLEAALGSTATP